MKNSLQPRDQNPFSIRQTRQALCLMLLIGVLAVSSMIAIASAAPGGTSQLAAAALSSPIPQAAITGEWTGGILADKNDRIQLTLSRHSSQGNSTMGQDFPLSELQGLTREQAQSAKADVRFRLVREAGTFDFEGAFRNGKGAGLWTLTPSQAFLGEMRARGYDNLSEEKQVACAMLDVHIQAIDDLKAAGFTHLSLDDVFKATIFKVTPAYISELKSLGFENLNLEELVKGRIFKIDAQFAREVQEMGFGERSMESLVKMRIFKVTPEFLREMRTAGLENLSIEDLVKLRIFKIDPEFIARARASGQSNLDVEELVRMKIHAGSR